MCKSSSLQLTQDFLGRQCQAYKGKSHDALREGSMCKTMYYFRGRHFKVWDFKSSNMKETLQSTDQRSSLRRSRLSSNQHSSTNETMYICRSFRNIVHKPNLAEARPNNPHAVIKMVETEICKSVLTWPLRVKENWVQSLFPH